MRRVGKVLSLAHAIDEARAKDFAERLSSKLRPGSAAHALAVLISSAYPALGSWLEANPGTAEHLADDGYHTARNRATYMARLSARVGDLSDSDCVRRELRRGAAEERVRIALRELLPQSAGGAEIDVTWRELTELAEATIEIALAEAKGAINRRFGVPQTAAADQGKFVVLGMGKLGGEELNAGSDVDLIYLYDTDDGEIVGHAESDTSGMTLHDYWARVARRLTATLEEVTEDGFVWRVDLRLRPEGRSGPLVNSLAAAERYYESFGRLWERAALLRARPVAGDRDFGLEALRMLAPFVWRKRVAPQLAIDMIALLQRGRTELSENAERDLKLGSGGIREAEFFVQILQLIWGGLETRARTQGTIDGLRRLRALGYVTDREGREIFEGYLALRRAEHAVQFATGVQTHLLPDSEISLARLAHMLGFKDTSTFVVDIDLRRQRIAARLQSLLPSGGLPPSRWISAMAALDRGDRNAFIDAVGKIAAPLLDGPTAEVVDRWQDVGTDLFELARGLDAPLGARTREAFPTLAETLLDAVLDAPSPEQAARYLRMFFARVKLPGVYAHLLGNDSRVVRRFVEALGASAFVGDAVVRNPELGDFVLFARGPTSSEIIRGSIDAALADERTIRSRARTPSSEEDLEDELVTALRRAKARVTIEVALADLAGEMNTRQTTLALSDLADVSLEAATRFALRTPSTEPVRGIVVIAMGKLGGREIGYGSDLDVCFLFDPSHAPDDIDPTAYFSRCARHIIRLISISHGSGKGYELDTRLRPSGSQGLLVTSLDAFARYHDIHRRTAQGDATAQTTSPLSIRHVRAAAWERLALLRARVAAGDRSLGAEAIKIAHAAAYGKVEDFPSIAHEIHHLRMRMEQELSGERHGRRDVKFGRGGLVDIEFAVQLLQMRHGSDVRVRTTETVAAINALAVCGYLSPDHAETLRDGHAFLRKLEQRMRIVHADASHLLEETAPGLPPLARRIGIRGRTSAEASAELLAQYAEVTERIRASYEDIVVRVAAQAAKTA